MPDYTTYKAEDLLMDESFLDYCKGSNPEAIKFWDNFLTAHPQMSTEVDSAKKLYQLISVTVPVEEKNAALDKIKEEIVSGRYTLDTIVDDTPVYQMTASRKINWRRYVAAAAIIGIIASALLWYNLSGNKQNASVTAFAKVNYKEVLSAGNNQRREVQLPDGSVALLNYGSSLKIADNFNQSARWVYLEGEAFFSVKKDKEKPFVVITSKTATTALGTSFKVRNYPGEQNGSVMLATGKVKVQSLIKVENNKSAIILMPGEEASWKNNEQLAKFNFNQETLLDWRNTRIVFEKADLPRIIETLEFYYGVQVSLENKPHLPIAFTGRFYEKSLKDVLEAIAFTNKFNYSQSGNIVSIRFQ
jgi:ferric-dicitrate binding protein FerR (iron transport regulator)